MGAKKKYSDEFRAEAVNLVHSGMSCAQVERDLGITTGVVSKWVRDSKKPQADKDLEKRIKQLEKENARLQRERLILKKAVAIFSEDQ